MLCFCLYKMQVWLNKKHITDQGFIFQADVFCSLLQLRLHSNFEKKLSPAKQCVCQACQNCFKENFKVIDGVCSKLRTKLQLLSERSTGNKAAVIWKGSAS